MAARAQLLLRRSLSEYSVRRENIKDCLGNGRQRKIRASQHLRQVNTRELRKSSRPDSHGFKLFAADYAAARAEVETGAAVDHRDQRRNRFRIARLHQNAQRRCLPKCRVPEKHCRRLCQRFPSKSGHHLWWQRF